MGWFSRPKPPPQPPAPGTQIGSYRLVRVLGEGGMGTVFEAVHEGISGRAAIKILRPEAAVRHDIAARFFSEARAANAVEHPSILRVFDCGYTRDGLAYLTMEFLSGETLAQRLTRLGCLPLAAAVRLCRQAASALAAVHARGLVHRDLKPENLMIVRDPEAPGGERIKVLDFGIARLAEDLRHSLVNTRTGMVMGTPTYMAPEQCHGARLVNELADVYSLGVILYQVLTGRPPFLGEGVGELLAMHLKDAPVPIGQLAPDVPAELVELVHAMLDKSAAARPAMREVESVLRRLGVAAASADPESEEPDLSVAVTRQVKAVDLRLALQQQAAARAVEAPRITESLSAHDALGAAPPGVSRHGPVEQAAGPPLRSLAFVGEIRSALLSRRGLAVTGGVVIAAASVLLARGPIAARAPQTAPRQAAPSPSAPARPGETLNAEPPSLAGASVSLSVRSDAVPPSVRPEAAPSPPSEPAGPQPAAVPERPLLAVPGAPGSEPPRELSAPAAPRPFDKLYADAEREFGIGNYRNASLYARSLLKSEFYRSRGWVLIGKSACAVGRLTEADEARKRLAAEPNHLSILFRFCRSKRIALGSRGSFEYAP
ncbi:MAG: protein kinase [Polyangia bacterium]